MGLFFLSKMAYALADGPEGGCVLESRDPKCVIGIMFLSLTVIDCIQTDPLER